MRLTRCSSIL